MLIKIHKATRLAVAVCDSELIGKKFSDEKRQLDLTGKFFLGEKKNEEEIAELLDFYRQEDACFNLVGKKVCEIAKNIDLVSEDSIDSIQGVPFVLILG